VVGLPPYAAKLARIRKSTFTGDRLKGKFRTAHQRTRMLQAKTRAVILNGDASDITKSSGEIARTHMRNLCKFFNSRLFRRVRREPVLHGMDARVQVSAVVEIDALLLMMSIAPQVDNHLAGDLCRNQRTVVSLDESQGHVDSGSNPRTTDDTPILDEQAVGKDLRARAEFLEFRGAFPMGCATTVLQKPGLR